MSEQGKTVEANATETAPAKSPLDVMKAQYLKSNRVILMSGEAQDVFGEFVESFGEDDPLIDWTANTKYENPTFAIVSSENDFNRFIALPELDVALSDPIVRAKAYDWYLRTATRNAMKEGASEAQFQTSGGFFVGFDLDAFRFQAANWVSYFHEKGLKSIAIRTLKLALSSDAYAKSQFPRVPKTLWEKVLGAMADKATKAGKDASIFSHWLTSRDLKEVDVAEFTFTEDELSHVGDEPDEASADTSKAA